MRNFALGLIVGVAIAILGYGPYEIETEYLRNISRGLDSRASTCVVTSGLGEVTDSEGRAGTVRIVRAPSVRNAAKTISMP